ncbi:hypothetical protein EDD85DRAFT_951212 [Armillaria nabsnona]|nr:hypothetical protein EDD85DRAFT_951212 [Armillaria nabsnona]
MQITDFLLALKTVDRFAAINRPTLLQVPSFPRRLSLDKRTAEYATRLNKWPTQLQTLHRAFQQHARSFYAATDLVPPSDDQDLTHLGLEGRDVMLLMDYQRHTLQEHWMGMASQVDGVAIFMRSLLLHKGTMSDTYMSRLYQVMEQNGLASSVSAVLGAGCLKRRLADWKAAFGAAIFISPLIIFCGEGLGQVSALTGAIRAGSRIEAVGKPLTVRLVEREAWKCIVGVAAGMWDAEFGLAQFLQAIAGTIASPQAHTDEDFFKEALDDAQLYKLELEYNVAESNKRWLQETLPAWRQGCAIKTTDGLYVKKRQRSRSMDSVERHSWTQLFVLHMEEDTGEEDKVEDFTVHEVCRQERAATRRAAWRRGRRASVLFPIWEEEIRFACCEVEDLKTFQPEMPVLLTPLPEFGLVAADDDDQDGNGERERDGEHELDVGDTMSVDDVLSLNLEQPEGMSSTSAFLDGFSTNDMGMDIELPTAEDLAQEIEGNEDVEGADTEKESSSFALKLSRSECQRHMKLLEEDSTLEKKWRLMLLQSQPWLDTNSSTRPAKRAREDSSSGPA